MTTIKAKKLARVAQFGVLVSCLAEGRQLALEAAERYQRRFYVLRDGYNHLVRVSPVRETGWYDDCLFEAAPPKKPLRADPRAALARQQDGARFDQRAMHRSKVQAAEWRRAHGLPV